MNDFLYFLTSLTIEFILTLEDAPLEAFGMLHESIMGSILFDFIALDDPTIAMLVTTGVYILVVLLIAEES